MGQRGASGEGREKEIGDYCYWGRRSQDWRVHGQEIWQHRNRDRRSSQFRFQQLRKEVRNLEREVQWIIRDKH